MLEIILISLITLNIKIMDQYVIEFEGAMLYFDMIDLIELINKSEDDHLKMYIDCLQEIVNNAN